MKILPNHPPKKPSSKEAHSSCEQANAPRLSLVGTPIGNLEDITLRALKTLRNAPLIACESPLFSQKLLKHYEITTPLTTYHEHSTPKAREVLIKKIQEKKHVALISNAGLPLISDPGYKLVRLCIENNIHIEVIPGPSAALTALLASGLPTNQFFFQGFLPLKGARTVLENLKFLKGTLIFFESSKRLFSTLQKCYEALGDRSLVLMREMTKMFEHHERTSLRTFLKEFSLPLKGEITFLIEGHNSDALNTKELYPLLEKLMEERSLKDALHEAQKISGLKRSLLYKTALALKQKK